jgi:RHS repeat-associated protein
MADPSVATWTGLLFDPSTMEPLDGTDGLCDKYSKYVRQVDRAGPGSDFVNAPASTTLSFLDSTGCSACGGGAGGASASVGCVDIRITLGGSDTNYGVRGSIGTLRLFSDELTNGLASRAALQFLQGQSTNSVPLVIARDANGWLQEIVTTQVIARIEDVAAGFRVRIYTNTVSADTLLSTTTVTSNDTALTVAFDSDDLGVWTKRYEPTAEEGGRSAIALVEMQGTNTVLRRWISCAWSNGSERSEATIYRDGGANGGTLVSREVKTYRQFTNQRGRQVWRTVSHERGAGSEIRVSTTEYDSFGRQVMTVDPDGGWQRTVYAGDDLYAPIVKTIAPYENAPTNAWTNAALCRVHDTSRSSLVNGGTKITTVDESSVVAGITNSARRNILVQQNNTYSHARISETNIVYTGSGELATTTVYDWQNRPFITRYPDGTLESNKYTTLTWAQGPYKDRKVGQTETFRGATNLLNGTRTVTVSDAYTGQTVQRQTWTVADGGQLLTEESKVVAVDELWRPTMSSSLAGTNETVNGCCGVSQTVDTEGIVTEYGYDVLKRQITTTRAGVVSSNAFDAAGRVVATYRMPTNGVPILVSSNNYNTAGELVMSVDAMGNATTYSNWVDAVNGWVYRKTVYPNGSWTLRQSYRDGQEYQTSGPATHGVRHSATVLADGTTVRRETRLDTDGSPTPEWTESYTDMGGRSLKTVRNEGITTNGPVVLSQSFYNDKGQVWKQVDADNVTTLYAYNQAGEREIVAVDVNRNDQIDFAGGDRITGSRTVIGENDGVPVRRQISYVWTTDGLDTTQEVSVADSSVDGLRSWQVVNGLTNSTQIVIDRFAARKTVTTTAADGSQSISVYLNGKAVSGMRKDAVGAVLSSTTNLYDGLGRHFMTVDGRGTTNLTAYDIADRVICVTNAAGTPVQQVTVYQYDCMGRRIATLMSDSTSVFTAYFPSGEIATNWGARTYPVAYTYDYAGRMKTMTTWTNFSSAAGAAITTWNYDSTNGVLVSKKYHDGQGPTYAYTASGRLKTRTWARGVTTEYGYNNAGDMVCIDYSDATPDVTYAFDRRGRRTNMVSGADAIVYLHDETGVVTNETHAAGALAGYGLGIRHDALLRRSGLTVNTGDSVANDGRTFYAYDNASRLHGISNAAGLSVVYSYVTGADMVGGIEYAASGTARMTTTRTYDALNRLVSIANEPSGTGAVSFSYQYNLANERTQSTLSDGTFWDYGYDVLGQVTSGVRRWTSDNSVVSGQDYGYAFDDIGNRRFTTLGGTSSVASVYSANLLNQYTERTAPGAIDVMGSAVSNATVTVNNQPAVRQNEYFHARLAVSSAVSAVWTQVTAVAVLKNAGTNGTDIVETESGMKFVAKNPEAFSYDPDGNLTSDGRWAYSWDAENRLTAMETATNKIGTNVPVARLEFVYDAQSRRILKKVLGGWTGTTFSTTNAVAFLYDGWNVVASVGPTTASGGCTNHYVWGLDLSGSMQGAGGIGGLLFSTFGGTTAVSSAFYAFDGNGNVAALIDTTGGTTAAVYEYSPFGETIRSTGPMAEVNPYRFSTKYTDDETGLLYYGFRSYSPSLGRWVSRDPIEEEGGSDVYEYVQNCPTALVDGLGMWPGMSISIPSPFMFPGAASLSRELDGIGEITSETEENVYCIDDASTLVPSLIGTVTFRWGLDFHRSQRLPGPEVPIFPTDWIGVYISAKFTVSDQDALDRCCRCKQDATVGWMQYLMDGSTPSGTMPIDNGFWNFPPSSLPAPYWFPTGDHLTDLPGWVSGSGFWPGSGTAQGPNKASCGFVSTLRCRNADPGTDGSSPAHYKYLGHFRWEVKYYEANAAQHLKRRSELKVWTPWLYDAL